MCDDSFVVRRWSNPLYRGLQRNQRSIIRIAMASYKYFYYSIGIIYLREIVRLISSKCTRGAFDNFLFHVGSLVRRGVHA